MQLKKILIIPLMGYFFTSGFGLCPMFFGDKSFVQSGIVMAAPGDQKKDATKPSNTAVPVTTQQPVAGEKATATPDQASAGGDFLDYKSPKFEEQSVGWLTIKAIFVVLLLGGGCYFLFRFVTKKSGLQRFGGEALRSVAVIPIGQSKYIQVVELAGRLLVLGVTDHAINNLLEITDRDEIERIKLLSSRSTPVMEGGFQEYFKNQLAALFQKGKPVGKKPERHTSFEENLYESMDGEDDDAAHFRYLQEQRQRLNKMNGKRHEEE